jgi:ferredoxin/flavodoxin---NADP+ reductase
MIHEQKDITIIGAGPAGLFGLFYAGMRGVSAQVVDALPEPGGQLMALYPEKFIFDVAGFPKVMAKDLVKQLVEQEKQFGQPVHLNQKIIRLDQRDGRFALVSETDEFPTKAIIIAAGIGAFSPRRLPQACAEPWYGRGIYDVVTNPDDYTGKRVVIIGGGDSAFDWGVQLLHRAEHVTIIHRSDRFRAHDATVNQFKAAVAANKAALLTFHELNDVVCANGSETFTHLMVKDVKAKTTSTIEANVVLPMLGFVSDMGAINEWGLKIEKDEIIVTSTMDTGRPGIYAAGDVTKYDGKLKLIATGFGEAATAVNQAVHWIYPEKKIAPGHSSNMAVFGQKDD